MHRMFIQLFCPMSILLLLLVVIPVSRELASVFASLPSASRFDDIPVPPLSLSSAVSVCICIY